MTLLELAEMPRSTYYYYLKQLNKEDKYKEMYLQEFESIEHFKKELIEYIDYYNNKRVNGKLKGMSPVNYRIHSLKVA